MVQLLTPCSRRENVINFVWMVLLFVPYAVFMYHFLYSCPDNKHITPAHQTINFHFSLQSLPSYHFNSTLWENTCRVGASHPLLMINLVLFINVDILFWLHSLLVGSTWLIDPYWVWIPLMIVHFYMHHPAAVPYESRSYVLICLLYVWAIRLQHSYFRREEWNLGAREDWRFAELRAQYGKHWWWISLPAAYISQHVFLFGITLPFYLGVHQAPPSFQLADWGAAITCLLGIACAHSADTTLRQFMCNNHTLQLQGKPKVLLLEQGLWYYSRHPNYFGEQVWWWGVAWFAYNQGASWMLLGAFLNSVCLGVATVMVEARMLRVASRRALYERYQSDTSVWIPFFKYTWPWKQASKKNHIQ